MREGSLAALRSRPTTLAGLVLVVGLIELALLRVGTRTAVHIPGLDRLSWPFRAVAASGRLTYYLAVVLLVALLVLLAEPRRDGVGAAGVVAFLAAAGLARVGLLSVDGLGVVLLGLVVLLIVSVARPTSDRLFLLLFGAGFLGASADQLLASSGSALPLLAESLAVGAGMTAPLTLRGRIRGKAPALAAVLAFSLVLGALLASPWTTNILLLWNFGLTGSLPAVAYALAAGGLASTIVAAARTGRTELAWGLGLLVLGGIGLLNTYQSGLTVAGLVLARRTLLAPRLTLAVRADRRAGRGRAPSPSPSPPTGA